MRRQRGHGILILAAPAQRPRPPQLATRLELRLAMVDWIERTYHRERQQRSPSRLTPIELETINRTAQAA